MPRSYRDELLASTDPMYGRRVLDQMECARALLGQKPRRISGRLLPPGSQPFERWLAERGYTHPDQENSR
jgi:hypothetical protein